MKRSISTLLLLALAACGSATDGTSFQVPSGYTQSVSVGPFMEMWTKGTNSVVLVALPVKSDLSKATKSTNLRDASMNSRPITICGSQAAFFLDGTAKVNTGGAAQVKRGRIEMVVTTVGSKTYSVVYRRDLDAPLDPAVDAAIKNICPKQ